GAEAAVRSDELRTGSEGPQERRGRLPVALPPYRGNISGENAAEPCVACMAKAAAPTVVSAATTRQSIADDHRERSTPPFNMLKGAGQRAMSCCGHPIRRAHTRERHLDADP